MRKIISIIPIFLLAFYGCVEKENNNILLDNKQNEEYSNIEFKRNDFKIVVDSFIRDMHFYPTHSYDDILVYFELNKSDTILNLMNCPPFEREGIIFVNKYDKYTVYFYAPPELENKLNTFVKNPNQNLHNRNILIDSLEVDAIYQVPYRVNGTKIELKRVPLIWSTDS